MFTTRRDEEKRAATIVEDAFGLHVAGGLPRDDALWEILAGAEEIQVNAEDGTVTTLHLRGSQGGDHPLSVLVRCPAAGASRFGRRAATHGGRDQRRRLGGPGRRRQWDRRRR